MGNQQRFVGNQNCFPNLALSLALYSISLVRGQGISFQKNHKDLDPSCKMDLDLWGCFGRQKTHFIAELHKSNLHICFNFGKINSHLITE